ncbi:MAG: fibrinogen-like YCDxxxxGGGW domain-containing protein, partial [Candidatus Gracilibacteria bacterium]|nr:fibrinogen-like YCDxxxxGGGW domain-containing protein [Candidatus Gracilibacteria bacterium]
ICQAGYYYNTNLCNAASIGNYVSTSGLTSQTACSANDKYQDITGQTSCKNVSTGYYSTPVGNVAHTGQTQCEANNYCIGGIKYPCSAGYSSPAGSSSSRACIINQFTITGTITNGNGATVNICGKTTTADTSGNFSVTANYGTNCNNLTISRTNYTCSVSTNGPSSINNNSSVAGTCSANSQTYTCSGLPSNAIWNTVSSYTQTWNGSAWVPANSTTTYNTTASTTSCNYKCNTNYTNVSNVCEPIGKTSSNPGSSCNDIKIKIPSSIDGTYWIDPDGATVTISPFQVYCDMTNDGGGWTLVVRGIAGTYDHRNSNAVGTINNPLQTTSGKFSDSIINSIQKTIYRANNDGFSVSVYFDTSDSFSSIRQVANKVKPNYSGTTWYGPYYDPAHIGLNNYQVGVGVYAGEISGNAFTYSDRESANCRLGFGIFPGVWCGSGANGSLFLK